MQITNLGDRGMFVKTLNQEIKGAKKRNPLLSQLC